MQKVPDFSSCPNGFRDYGGSDNKISVEYGGDKYMVKLPERIEQKQNAWQTSSINNVFSEHIGSRIVASLGIPVHETQIVLYHDKPAVACKDFTSDGYRLQEFSWMMRSMLDRSEVKRIPTYQQLYDVMEHHPMLSGIKDEAISRYWETFAVDALIGNFDRHKGNWGYLVNEKTRDIKLAPVYDCGSSLYPNLSEEGMTQVLGSREEIEKRIYQFPKAALNKNENPGKEEKFGYLEMLSSNMDCNCTKAFLSIYRRLDMKKINAIVDETPLLSDIRKYFYKEMLGYRKKLILDRAYELLREKSRAGEIPREYFVSALTENGERADAIYEIDSSREYTREEQNIER